MVQVGDESQTPPSSRNAPDRTHDVAGVEATIIETLNLEDPRLSRARFWELIDASPTGSPTALVYRTQVARALGLLREFDEARTALDAVALRADDQPASAASDHVHARLAIERGRVLNSAGSPAEALPEFLEAYRLATAAGAPGLAVDALHMCAIAAGSVDGPAATIAWNDRAIAEAEASDDPAARAWLGSLFNNSGWARHDAGEFHEAVRMFARALAVQQESGEEPELTIARWAVARCLRSLGRIHEALRIQEELAESPVGAGDGFVHEERGECLLALGRAEEARPAFALAYQLLCADEWLAATEPDRLARLRDLA